MRAEMSVAIPYGTTVASGDTLEVSVSVAIGTETLFVGNIEITATDDLITDQV